MSGCLELVQTLKGKCWPDVDDIIRTARILVVFQGNIMMVLSDFFPALYTVTSTYVCA